VVNLANAEDLPGHGDAIRARFAGGEQCLREWEVPGQ
jgi:histidinol dehydrogenase